MLDENSCNSLLKEEIIQQEFKDENNQTQTLKLRRIAWYDEKKDRCYEFITNNFEIDATMIAQLYQYRWKIELFFKKLKKISHYNTLWVTIKMLLKFRFGWL